ncbi:MAG: nascent polypeptide-associated complex protein [Thermoplasmata archaeon]
MMPGGRMNPRQMQLMMKRLGMTTEEIGDVEEVILRTATEEHVFDRPEVSILTVQGVTTYQVVGTPRRRPRSAGVPLASDGTAASAAPAAPAGPPEEDIRLVMEQAGVERAEAIRALAAHDGQPAEAILSVLSRRGAGGG